MNNKFSIYPNPSNRATVPIGEATLRDIYLRIISSEWESNTIATRNAYSLLQETKKSGASAETVKARENEYRGLKGGVLLSASFGGVFDYRSSDSRKLAENNAVGLLSPSGLIVIDIDHLSEGATSPEDLRKTLSQDKESGVRLIFLSPSGDGLKMVCETDYKITDKKSYETAWRALSEHLKKTYGIEIDKSGKDITRLCYLCQDKDAILLTEKESRSFNVEEHPIAKKTPVARLYESVDDDFLEGIVQKIEKSEKDIAPSREEWLPLVYSLTTKGETGRAWLHRITRNSPKYNEADTNFTFDYCSKSEDKQSIVPFLNMARVLGYTTEKEIADYKVKKMKETKKEEPTPDFEKALSTINYDDFERLTKSISEGIPTGYKFEKTIGGIVHSESLTLNPGLTFICGGTGHGKTSFLNNIALNIIDGVKEGTVLYFSYEIAKPQLLLDFLNLYTNEPKLSHCPIETIRSYKQRGANYFNQGERIQGETYFEYFKAKEWDFKRLLSAGRLVLCDEPYSVEVLIQAIRHYQSKHKVLAVMVDYAQLLYSTNYSRQRTEEIKRVVNDLKNFANEAKLPIVLGAQFNREVSSPISVKSTNIGEGGDFERIADTVVGIFNLKELRNVPREDQEETRKLLSDLLRAQGNSNTYSFEDMISRLDGHIFARLMKRRYGEAPLDTLLTWEGRTKKIEINDPHSLYNPEESQKERLTQEPEEVTPSFDTSIF